MLGMESFLLSMQWEKKKMDEEDGEDFPAYFFLKIGAIMNTNSFGSAPIVCY